MTTRRVSAFQSNRHYRGSGSAIVYNCGMVSVVHSVAAQSDFEHSLQTLSEGLSAEETEKIRAAAEFARTVYGDRLLGSDEGVWHHALGMALILVGLKLDADTRVAALLFASRAGSSITAEIGLMKATEQLTAMDMMAVNPIARVVAPRFWGGVLSMPLLAALFSAIGVFGGYLIGVVFIGVDEGAFWSQMQGSVDFRFDIWNGVVKSFVFGVAVSLIAVFEGYDAVPTAEGVSSSIKRTVVYSALAILALDFVLTSFMFRGV